MYIRAIKGVDVPSSAIFWTVKFGSVGRTIMFDCWLNRVNISVKFATLMGST